MSPARMLTASLCGIVLCTAVVTGCTGEEPASCAPVSDLSAEVSVTGDLGGEVSLASQVPLSIGGPQRAVLIHGAGEVRSHDDVDAKVTVFSAASGRKVLTERVPVSDGDEAVRTYAGCSEVGDRVAVIDQAAHLLGADAVGEHGLGVSENLLYVIDFVAGCTHPVARDKGFPRVELGDGTREPEITIPACMRPPAKLEVDVLADGDGPVVEAGQRIMTRYVGVDWNGAARFDGDWSETGVSLSTTSGALIDGFTQAMVGQRIGSTVLVTIPPHLGYDDGVTRTFVLQLLSVDS